MIDFEYGRNEWKGVRAVSHLIEVASGHPALHFSEWAGPSDSYVPQEVLDRYELAAAAVRASAPSKDS